MPLFIETYSSLVGFVPQCLGQALQTPTSFKDFSCLWHFQSIPDPTGMHYSLAHFPLLRHDILTNFESILYRLIFRIKVLGL